MSIAKSRTRKYNTKLLLPFIGADNDQGLVSSGRAQGSPSFMKSVFGTGWGKTAPGIGPQGQSISVDPRYSIDPGIFGPIVQGAKQVRQSMLSSFHFLNN